MPRYDYDTAAMLAHFRRLGVCLSALGYPRRQVACMSFAERAEQFKFWAEVFDASL